MGKVPATKIAIRSRVYMDTRSRDTNVLPSSYVRGTALLNTCHNGLRMRSESSGVLSVDIVIHR